MPRGRTPGRAEGAALRRQTEGLRELLAAADKGSLLSLDRLAIGIKAELLRDLLQRRLPIETVIGDQLRVRVERAEVSLENGQSLVTLQGRVSPVHEADAFADLELLGGLHRLEVDPGSGILTARVVLDRIEVQRFVVGGIAEPRFLSRACIRSFSPASLVSVSGRPSGNGRRQRPG